MLGAEAEQGRPRGDRDPAWGGAAVVSLIPILLIPETARRSVRGTKVLGTEPERETATPAAV